MFSSVYGRKYLCAAVPYSTCSYSLPEGTDPLPLCPQCAQRCANATIASNRGDEFSVGLVARHPKWYHASPTPSGIMHTVRPSVRPSSRELSG